MKTAIAQGTNTKKSAGDGFSDTQAADQIRLRLSGRRLPKRGREIYGSLVKLKEAFSGAVAPWPATTPS